MLQKWSMALVAMLCQGLGGGLVAGFSFFVNPLVAEFDTNVSTINAGFSLLIFIAALWSPVVGKLVDTIDLKKLLLAGAILSGLGFVLMAQATTLTQLALAFSCYVVGMVSYGPVATNAMLIRRYGDECGRALAIAAIGISIASIVMPVAVVALMESQGWRGASVAIGVTVSVLLCISIVLWIPSQKIQAAPAEDNAAGAEQGNWYLRDREFWIIGINFAVLFSLASVVALCYAPHFDTLGFTSQQAALLVSLTGAAGLLGKMSFGVLAEQLRRHIILVLCAMCLIQLGGWLMLFYATSMQGALIAVVLVGLTAGAFIPIYPFVNSLYFDKEIIGAVSGAQVPLLLPLGLAGPLAAGWVYDTYGGYQWAFAGMAFITVLVCVSFLAMRKAEEKIT